jgi:hypothetical protein
MLSKDKEKMELEPMLPPSVRVEEKNITPRMISNKITQITTREIATARKNFILAYQEKIIQSYIASRSNISGVHPSLFDVCCVTLLFDV